MYWDGQNWQPPTAATARPAAPTPWDQFRPYVDKARPQVAKGRRRWSGLRPEHKVMVAIAGLLVAVALIAVPVIAFNYLFGGGSGPSAAYQDGYNLDSRWPRTNRMTPRRPPLRRRASTAERPRLRKQAAMRQTNQTGRQGCMAGYREGHSNEHLYASAGPLNNNCALTDSLADRRLPRRRARTPTPARTSNGAAQKDAPPKRSGAASSAT